MRLSISWKVLVVFMSSWMEMSAVEKGMGLKGAEAERQGLHPEFPAMVVGCVGGTIRTWVNPCPPRTQAKRCEIERRRRIERAGLSLGEMRSALGERWMVYREAMAITTMPGPCSRGMREVGESEWTAQEGAEQISVVNQRYCSPRERSDPCLNGSRKPPKPTRLPASSKCVFDWLGESCSPHCRGQSPGAVRDR